MRWLSVFIATLLLSATLSAAGAAEIDGFRGLKWGTELASLNSADFTKVPPFKGIAPETESYQRKGDELKVAGMPVEYINYNFHKGRLVSVNIDFRGFPIYEKLMAYCKELFGPPTGSMVKSMEFITTFESPGTEALLYYLVTTPQFSDGRLFLYARGFMQ